MIFQFSAFVTNQIQIFDSKDTQAKIIKHNIYRLQTITQIMWSTIKVLNSSTSTYPIKDSDSTDQNEKKQQ